MFSAPIRTWLVPLSFALIAPLAWASPGIDVTVLADGLTFHSDFDHHRSWLRVSGPDGFSAQRSYGANDDLVLTFAKVPADGTYSWEILAVGELSDAAREELIAGRERQETSVVNRLRESGALRSATFFGTFAVRGGQIGLPTASYSGDDRDIAIKDQVIADDLNVQGSACVGADCGDSTSFGFDTLRLQENNLRIAVVDTSSSSGTFPSNDWSLVFNDSASDGGNYFGVRDDELDRISFRVDAGAPRNALRILSSGNVGLGTSAPAVDFHIVSGNTPALRLEQDGSNGFAAQSWDLAANETNFFVRDVNDASNLPFRILPRAGQNALVIDSDGHLGLNSAAPRARLHVRESGTVQQPSNSAVVAVFQNNGEADIGSIVSLLAGNGSANAQLWFGDSDDDNAGRIIYRNGSDAMSFWTNGGERLFIEGDGDLCVGCNNAQGDAIRHSNGARLTAGGTWTNASSRALKTGIRSLSADQAMSALVELEPVLFQYTAELDETHVGFIAEDVPALVAMNDRASLTAMDVVAVLTKVVKEQQKAIEELRAAQR